MIAESFGFVQFPILPLVKADEADDVQLFRRNPKLCTPRDFDYSPYFDIIKYPFYDFRHHKNYRLLPWSSSSALTAEESDLYGVDHEHLTLEEVDESIELALVNAQSGQPETNEQPDTTDSQEIKENR